MSRPRHRRSAPSWSVAAAVAAGDDLDDWMKMRTSWPLPDQLSNHAPPTSTRPIAQAVSILQSMDGVSKLLNMQNSSNNELQPCRTQNTTAVNIKVPRTSSVHSKAQKTTQLASLCTQRPWYFIHYILFSFPSQFFPPYSSPHFLAFVSFP